MKSLKEYLISINESIDFDKSRVKFTIWEAPNKKVKWLYDNNKYLKIEYEYVDKYNGIAIQFLLGFKDNTWMIWFGKPGVVFYDDDPYCSFNTTNFADAIEKSLDVCEEVVKFVYDDPVNYKQYYIAR